MSYVTNVDRTVRNTNMLMWHRRLWLIDHGATLYFHHAPGWPADRGRASDPFPPITDPSRLLALDATLDVEATRANLETIPVVCRGGREAGAIGQLPQRSRFHWLVSPRSTIIQFSPVHTGRTDDPEATLERLLETMVRPSTAGSA